MLGVGALFYTPFGLEITKKICRILTIRAFFRNPVCCEKVERRWLAEQLDRPDSVSG